MMPPPPYFDIPLNGSAIAKIAVAASSPAPAAASAEMSDEAVNAMLHQLQQDNPGLPLLTVASESSGVRRVDRKPDDPVLRLGSLPELKNIRALEGSVFMHLVFRNALVTDSRVLHTTKRLRSLFLDLPEGTDCEQSRGLLLEEVIATRLASVEPFAGPRLATLTVIAREKATAPDTSEVFGAMNSTLGAATRMDPEGIVAFEAQTKPSNKSGLWYQFPLRSTTKLCAAGDTARGTSGATFSTFEQPSMGSGGAVAFRAFLGTVSGAGITSANDKAVWRSANGGTPTLLLRTGDSMATSQGSKTVFSIDLPGSNMDIRSWELPVMDDTGRLLLIVTFTDKSSAQVIAQ